MSSTSSTDFKVEPQARKRFSYQFTDNNAIRVTFDTPIRVTMYGYSYMGIQSSKQGRPFIRLECVLDKKAAEGTDFNGNGLLKTATNLSEFTQKVVQLFQNNVREAFQAPSADITIQSGINALKHYGKSVLWCLFPHTQYTKYFIQDVESKKVVPFKSINGMIEKGNSYFRLDGNYKMTEFRLEDNGTISALTFLNISSLTILDNGQNMKQVPEPEERKFQSDKAIMESSDFLASNLLTYDDKKGDATLFEDLKGKFVTLPAPSSSEPLFLKESKKASTELTSSDYESFPPKKKASRGKKKQTPYGSNGFGSKAKKDILTKWRLEE